MKPTMFVFKRRRGTKSSRTWYVEYGLPNEPTRRINTGFTEKRAAEAEGTRLLQELEAERAGIVLPSTIRNAAAEPLESLIERLIDAGGVRGGSSFGHRRNLRYYLNVLREACGWLRIRDITSESFCQWRTRESDSGERSAKTLNEYLNALRSFFSWLKRERMVLHNPLEGVQKLKPSELRRERRAITPDEFKRLLAVSGDRAFAYLLLAKFAWRVGDLAAAQWEWVDRARDHWIVRVPAHVQKGKRIASMPVDSDVRKWMESRGNAAGWTGPIVSVPSLFLFRKDLLAAEIAEIDATGRRVDRHALRHSGITWAADVPGASHAQVREMARHTDDRMTRRYTDRGGVAVRHVVEGLPKFFPSGQSEGQLEGSVRGYSSHEMSPPVGEVSISKEPEIQGSGRSRTCSVGTSRRASENWGSRIRT